MSSAKLLASMLNELSECLGQASDSGTSPNPSELLIHERMRNVMFILLEECINISTGKFPLMQHGRGPHPMLYVVCDRPSVMPQSRRETWWCCCGW